MIGDEHAISLQPGTVIAGRYEVVKCLGAGSMGLVYACRHRELAGHMVAVKVLFGEVAQDKIAAARFRNEIFASYGVSHPNVVRAYEYLRDGDLVAYTMEYVDGGALSEKLESPGSGLPVSECVSILSQMCYGVQAIHDAGIVHRDLKPENILLTRDGVVKIADFGIARTGHGPRLTEHGGVVGTIDYVSPEYMLNSQVDWRSDIYAIGILGYEMLTGESPFRGDSVYATMTKRLKSDPKPPSALRPECPGRLDEIVLKAMHRDPELRYQSAAEMFYDLRALSTGEAAPKQHGGQATAIEMDRRSGGFYVGPVVDNPSALKRRKGRGSKTTGSSRGSGTATGLRRETVPERQERAMAQGWDDAGAGRGAVDPMAATQLAATQLLPGTVEEMMRTGREKETFHEPIRMERVLAAPDMVNSGWGPGDGTMAVEIKGMGIDQARIQRLSQLSKSAGSPQNPWSDRLTVVFSVVIGLGIGLVLMFFFDPAVFTGGDQSSEERVLDVQAIP